MYFTEVTGSSGVAKYVPRSLQLDLESGVCNRVRMFLANFPRIDLLQIKGGPLGTLFRPDTYLSGEAGAGNNWAKGCEL